MRRIEFTRFVHHPPAKSRPQADGAPLCSCGISDEGAPDIQGQAPPSIDERYARLGNIRARKRVSSLHGHGRENKVDEASRGPVCVPRRLAVQGTEVSEIIRIDDGWGAFLPLVIFLRALARVGILECFRPVDQIRLLVDQIRHDDRWPGILRLSHSHRRGRGRRVLECRVIALFALSVVHCGPVVPRPAGNQFFVLDCGRRSFARVLPILPRERRGK
mmetsp:Transcript_12662/g.27326  ORF Transcript_12662/g.27326 Transcript_12662/m.27326 type:complete len:218 (-) Transcript_12662:88-741(-)